MAKLKGRAKQFAELGARDPKGTYSSYLFCYLLSLGFVLLTLAGFDPEEDVPGEGSEGSDSEASDDGLAGTEHYEEVR